MKLSELDRSKIYTYADYYTWDFEERVELINGKVFDLPAPWTVHQLISGKITYKFFDFLKHNTTQLFIAPFDVRLIETSKDDSAAYTVVQPDLCIICDPNKIDERGCIGTPDIMIEILSAGNNQKELRDKFDAYEKAEVKEYWIIHPYEKTFLKYILNDGKFQASKLLTMGDNVLTPVLPGFVLQLDEIFSDDLYDRLIGL